MNRITTAALLALAAGSAAARGHAGSWLPGDHGHSVELLAATVVGTLWLALAAGPLLVVGVRRLLAARR